MQSSNQEKCQKTLTVDSPSNYLLSQVNYFRYISRTKCTELYNMSTILDNQNTRHA